MFSLFIIFGSVYIVFFWNEEFGITDRIILQLSLSGHRDTITGIDFNVNGKQLASSSLDSAVILWKIYPRLHVIRLAGHKVTCVSFSPSGALLASSSKDKTVRLWIPSAFVGHTAAVRHVEFSHDGQCFITCSDDKSIWTTHRQRFQSSYIHHSNWVSRSFASVSDDKTVRLWDRAIKDPVQTFRLDNSRGTSIRFHPGGYFIGGGIDDGSVKIWDILHNASVNDISFHPSGNYLITASSDGTAKVLDLIEGRLFYTIHGHKVSIKFSCDGQNFATGGADEQLFLWKTNFDLAVKKVQEKENETNMKKYETDYCSAAEDQSLPRNEDPQNHVKQLNGGQTDENFSEFVLNIKQALDRITGQLDMLTEVGYGNNYVDCGCTRTPS
ncbi:POC1 centriolar protein homolog A-like [Octopus sinensis]|uniref:POC1 centriolar protein homolog A-like n=1 Tax=Octopus sinensis TaxID=2607531 RepID=A0A6P7TXR7_9MOLL|nr:POC1 centriolar protein homolog A-like [Octopus sinensis]